MHTLQGRIGMLWAEDSDQELSFSLMSLSTEVASWINEVSRNSERKDGEGSVVFVVPGREGRGREGGREEGGLPM